MLCCTINFFKRESKAKKNQDEHSEPPDSMLEMLNMISDLQSERMDSQRAELRPVNKPAKETKETKATSLPGLRAAQTTSMRPEDDFLDMIARVQGSTRLDDQRSELPRPKPAPEPPQEEDSHLNDDFFTNLMRAQAGRMEDQRASIPLKESSQNKATNSKNAK